MPATVVIGGQWGDEGKGRIVDLLARRATIVARYSAGDNAGHTVINDRGKFKLNVVPAGIFYGDKTCIVGNGVALEPARLLTEIDKLVDRGVAVDRLYVSDRAHVVMPYHPIIDRLDEALRGPLAVGTTGRGVGPAFADKVGRIGIRVGDLVDTERFTERLRYVLEYKNRVLTHLYGAAPLDFDTVLREYSAYGRRLQPFVTDTSLLVQQALDRGEDVLLEGAQGALLDLDFGTYEYVTSSVPSSSAAGAALGIGIGPNEITRTVGVYKAYQTRVGGGPMPTELFDETAAHIARRGDEFGTNTGRARRCGWFDAVAAQYTRRLNGLTDAVVTRLDVLDELPELKIGTAYAAGGERLPSFPASLPLLQSCQPVYETLPGWQCPTSDVRAFDDLPLPAQGYVRRIEQLLGCPVSIVSVGPEREQAIRVRSIIGA
ncbi:MAG TPA: adenylosuccinate synthase [Dehalococcoidia bacterium]|nr:adenylosuccinate synthase [Dehalococcoidia bacterium]